MPKDDLIKLRSESDLKRRLEKIAKKRRWPLAGLVRDVLYEYVERKESELREEPPPYTSSSPVSQDIKALEQAAQLEADRLRRESQRKRATPSPNARKRKPKPGASN